MPRVHLLRFLLIVLCLSMLAGSLFAAHHFNRGQISLAYLVQADGAIRRNSPGRAIHYQRLYLEDAPNDVRVLKSQAQLLARRTDADSLDEAHVLFERLLMLRSEDCEARRTLIDLTLKAVRYADAQHHIEELLKSSPPTAKLLCGLAYCRWSSLDYSNARRHLESALVVQPDHREAAESLFDLGFQTRDRELMELALCFLCAYSSEERETAVRFLRFLQFPIR